MFISVGLLVLTGVYLGMVATLEHYFKSECLGSGICFPEGVDNTILTWSSDFFVAICAFLFALHLSFYASEERDVRKSGIMAQIFMGGAFLAAGVGRLLYPNSGSDDNRGMVGYWFVQIIGMVFFGASALAMSRFAISTSEKKEVLVLIFGSIVVIAMSLFVAGGIWCTLIPELQVVDVVDTFEPNNDVHSCIKMMDASTVMMNFAYGLLWLPVGVILKSATAKRPLRILGLPTPAAAITAVVLQWTVGSIFVGMFYLVSLSPKIDYFEDFTKIYGTVIYHWAMLLSLYCLHNLSYGIPWEYYESSVQESVEEKKFSSTGVYPIEPTRSNSVQTMRSNKRRSNKKKKDEPTPLSWEWWVSGVASMFPEPKNKTRTMSMSNSFDEKSVVSDGFLSVLEDGVTQEEAHV